jgi:stage II sporulation protein D
MKFGKSLLVFFACFLSFSLMQAHQSEITSSLTDTQKPATVKLLIEKGSSGVLLEARGSFQVINPETGKNLSSGRKGKRFYLYPHKEGIRWGEDFLGIFQIQIVPTSSNTTLLVNGIQYRGAIEVYHVEDKLNIVNEIDVESFLKSTLSQKFQGSYPDSVVDAIAIIARTNAYYHALFNHEAFWHLDAKEEQYTGVGLAYQNLPIERAIDNTRHLVMTFEEQPFPAGWTEHCGGKTAPYQTIFRKNTPTPDGVHSVFAAKERKETRWAFNMNTQELAKVVKTNRITGIDLFVDHFSGKVYAVRIHDGSHVEDVDFLTLQKYIGKERLKSNDFAVSIKDHIASFEGYGAGVGVGLCLYSASQMAERGDDVPRMLAEFFPYTHIEKMRSYPEAIISAHQGSFISPKQKKASEKKRRLLH